MNTVVQNNVEILITNLSLKNDGFAVTCAAGDGVYIPPSVTTAADIVPGETRKATLVENDPDRQDKSKYKAVFIENGNFKRDPDEDEYDEPSLLMEKLADIEKRIMDALEDAESYLTTREIAREVNEQSVTVRDRLNKLFSSGDVARADIFHHSNRRAMNVLWATDPEKFL